MKPFDTHQSNQTSNNFGKYLVVLINRQIKDLRLPGIYYLFVFLVHSKIYTDIKLLSSLTIIRSIIEIYVIDD